MPAKTNAAEAAFARLASAISKDRRVDAPDLAKAKGFGSKGLKVKRKMFAFQSKGRLVVKLPAERVDELIAARIGERFDPGHGRLMKEWLAVGVARKATWMKLALEALEYAS